MTETEWLQSSDPERLLRHVVDRANVRQLKWFACVCLKHVWHRFEAQQAQHASKGFEACMPSVARVSSWTSDDIAQARAGAVDLVHFALELPPEVMPRFFRVQLCEALRDIMGNPFRTVAVASAWQTWNNGEVVNLARTIYDEHRFHRFEDYRRLSEALQKSGCRDMTVIGHCLQTGIHSPGCWLLDLLLDQQ